MDASFLLDKYGWQAVDELDNWLYIFDRLPPKMKLMVDFATQGFSVKEIAGLTKTKENTVRQVLGRAKERIIRGEDIGYSEEM